VSAAIQGWTLFWGGGEMSTYANGNRQPGEPVIVGGQVTLIGGTIEPCRYGLHGSERLLDALGFSPCRRPTIGRCEFGGEIEREADKLAARSRTVLWLLDADQSERVLRVHARWSALTVLHLWDAPDVVTRYLVTGDESLRDAARDAAWAAAWDAAWAASNAGLERLAWCAHRGEPVELAVPESARAIVERVMSAPAGQGVGG
jgi:hypothetical protein